jgi:GT2 family glycosyltransferase
MGGPVVNLLADNLFSEATQAIMSYITITWNRRSGHATFFTCSNLLLPRKKLIEIGGFDRFWQGAGEDRDLCRRWCEHDLPMSMVPQAAVGHAHRLNIWSFLQQHFNYGVGRWWCEQRRTKPHLGPPMWSGLPFYFNLLLYPFDRYPLLQAVSVSVLIGFAQLATAAGYCKARYV